MADTRFGDDVEGASFFQRKMVGPLATAFTFAFLTAPMVAIMTPTLPMWIATLMLAVMALCTVLLFRRTSTTEPALTNRKKATPTTFGCKVDAQNSEKSESYWSERSEFDLALEYSLRTDL